MAHRARPVSRAVLTSLLLLVAASTIAAVSATSRDLTGGATTGRHLTQTKYKASDAEFAKIKAYVEEQNGNPVNVLTLKNGDKIGCVKRAANIAASPSTEATRASSGEKSALRAGDPIKEPVQATSDLAVQFGSCGDGLVPKLQLSTEYIATNFGTLDEYLQLGRKSLPDDGGKNGRRKLQGVGTTTHKWAHAAANKAATAFQTVLTVYNSYTELDSEFSLEQFWLTAGSGTSLNTFEAGLQVYAQIYGNRNVRLFTYHTNDGYASHPTGSCYNQCSNWVQVSSSIYPAATISPVSTVGGTTYVVTLQAQLYLGNWWLGMLQSGAIHWIGYVPSGYYSTLAGGASRIDVGGEIVTANTFGRHTNTDMGSGQFASVYPWSAYAYQMMYRDPPTGNWYYAESLSPYASEPACYSTNYYNTANGPVLWFGGPGYTDPACTAMST